MTASKLIKTRSCDCYRLDWCNDHLVIRNMILNSSSLNPNISQNLNSTLTLDEEEQSYELPIILISLSVALITVLCVAGVAVEIRDKQRQRERLPSTASTNPILANTSERFVHI